MGKLERNLPNDAYEAATNANNPSASNPFITEVESAVSSASLILYPTSAASVIPTYNKLVNTVSDPDYDDPAVDILTAAITTTGQLIGEFASEEGVISGNPGVVNVNTIGNLRRKFGTGTASFYFEVYHRDNLGTETLIGTSNTTGASSNPLYEQYFASCLINATNFGSTDRVVTKWYANRLSGGSDPIYNIQLGGATPVKITFPVPLVNLPSTVEELNDLTDVTTGLPGSPTNADDGRVLYYDVDSGQWISDDIANISNVVKDCKTSVGTGSIPKGTPVYLAGYDNDLLVVEPCDAASSATMPCIGVTAEALDSTNAKKVISFGKLQGFNTSLWADGTELYVAVGGGFTTTRPTGTAEIQRVAVVLKGLSAAGGSIKVFNTSRTAGLPNLTNGNTWVGDASGYPVETPLPTSPDLSGYVQGSGGQYQIATFTGIGNNIAGDPNFLWNGNDLRINTGDTTPTEFILSANGGLNLNRESFSQIIQNTWSNSNVYPIHQLSRFRGTNDAPLTPLNGDRLGEFRFSSNAAGSQATIEAYCTENHVQSGVGGTRLVFTTVANGETIRQNRLELQGDGSIKFHGLAGGGDYVFPLAQATAAGQVLTDVFGNGILTWETPSGGGGTNSFETVGLSPDIGFTWGTNDVVADSATDTLKLVAGSNITLETDAANDGVRISSTGGGSVWTPPKVGIEDILTTGRTAPLGPVGALEQTQLAQDLSQTLQ
jgi:hypothetical protein